MLLLISAVSLAMADALTDFKESRAINTPQTAVLVADLKSGKELVSLNASTPLIPASIMKSVTVATLLDKVGHDFRYVTPVYVTGKVRDGVLDGNIVVEASADPSINTAHEPGSDDIVSEIAEALKARHITRVTGTITVDESKYPGPAVNPTWASGDLPHAYGTGTHGFNFEDNASGRRSVSDPAAIFRTRLLNALRREGIEIGEAEVENRDRRQLLGEHRSATVDEIMRSCMMRSDNQFAEAMLRTVGEKYGREGSTATGADEEMEYWRKHKADMEGVKIHDGSGLSRSNRVTASFMGDVLKRMYRNPYYASFFPLAGQEGTLKRFLAGSPLEGMIALKTGSMSGIQCYAGYKLDEQYAPTHLVVVIMNGMSDRAAARREVEKLLLKTFGEE